MESENTQMFFAGVVIMMCYHVAAIEFFGLGNVEYFEVSLDSPEKRMPFWYIFALGFSLGSLIYFIFGVPFAIPEYIKTLNNAIEYKNQHSNQNKETNKKDWI